MNATAKLLRSHARFGSPLPASSPARIADELDALQAQCDSGNDRRPCAAGMYGLLSEIIARGALADYGDLDLIDRVGQAVSDYEGSIKSGDAS